MPSLPTEAPPGVDPYVFMNWLAKIDAQQREDANRMQRQQSVAGNQQLEFLTQLLNNQQGGYDEAKLANLQRYASGLEGYTGLHEDTMKLLEGYGKQRRKDTKDYYDKSLKDTMAQLSLSGLGGSTERASLARQNTTAFLNELGRVDESVLDKVISANERLTGGKLDFMERRSDPYPEQGPVQALLLETAKSGVLGGSGLGTGSNLFGGGVQYIGGGKYTRPAPPSGSRPTPYGTGMIAAANGAPSDSPLRGTSPIGTGYVTGGSGGFRRVNAPPKLRPPAPAPLSQLDKLEQYDRDRKRLAKLNTFRRELPYEVLEQQPIGIAGKDAYNFRKRKYTALKNAGYNPQPIGAPSAVIPVSTGGNPYEAAMLDLLMRQQGGGEGGGEGGQAAPYSQPGRPDYGKPGRSQPSRTPPVPVSRQQRRNLHLQNTLPQKALNALMQIYGPMAATKYGPVTPPPTSNAKANPHDFSQLPYDLLYYG